MNNQLVKDGYNKAAETFLKDRDQFKNIKYLKKLTAFLKSDSTILDIGCGAGRPTDEYLVSKNFKVLGIDISEKQIELAKKYVPDAAYEVKDMSELKVKEYTVDAVVSFYAIFHIRRELHHELFGKINSFLPTGGHILVTMGFSNWEGTEDNFHGVKMFWSHYDSKKNREIIERAGFKIMIDKIDTSGNEKHQVILARKI